MSLADATLSNLGSRIDLRKAAVLLVEPNNQAMDVLASIFLGFGATHCLKASSLEEAQQVVHSTPLDLIACEATLQPDGPDGYEFVSWLRRSGLDPNAFAPVLLLSSHTSSRNVSRARDCGAHFMVSKPLAPAVLLQRIIWIAQNNRTFVSCDSYVGPDRRFQNLGPPDGVGRRHNDLSAELGEATDRNMDQSEIDSLLTPQKVAR
ncbi:response regulator [Phenylobacterium sp.]|uniref:response regulator n=1 Tax=Phenylobacterium sp. TaxID=1871053 RepID=UPI0025E011D2|nr:response regulator [Phenylobacterium sp.]